MICAPSLPMKHLALVICVPLPRKHISPVICVTLTVETHIPKNMCSFSTREKYLPRDMSSFPNHETYIPSDMCSPTWESQILTDLSSTTREQISLAMNRYMFMLCI